MTRQDDLRSIAVPAASPMEFRTQPGAGISPQPRDRASVPLAPALLLALALLPSDLSVNLAGLFLSPPRVALLVLFPLSAGRMLRRAGRSGLHPSLSDWLIVPTSLWMFLAVSISQGVDRAIVGASVMILEFTGGYLVTRSLPLRPGPAVQLARFAAGAIAVAALCGPLDTLAGQHLIHNAANALTHYDLPWGLDIRAGLLRAMGTQDHPILLGTVSCFGAVLSVAMLRGARRAAATACCVAGSLSALSSAPIMATILALALLAYRRWTPRLRLRWWLLGAPMAAVTLVLLGASSDPFGFLFRHFTMDPQTGFYRLLIWQVAGALVLGSPWFGIGLDDWERASWMPSTVDAVWLRSAMSFGIVGSVLIGLVLLGACSRGLHPRGRTRLPAPEQDLGTALGIIIFLYAYLGFTVHFWGCTWIMMGMTAGLRAHLGAVAAAQPALHCPAADGSALPRA